MQQLRYNSVDENLRRKNRIYQKYFLWESPKNKPEEQNLLEQPYIQLPENKMLQANRKKERKKLKLLFWVALGTIGIYLLLLLFY